MPDETKAPKEIPSQGWEGPDESGLGISKTKPGDKTLYISTDAYETTTGTNLSVPAVREIAASLAQRADLMDPPARRKLGPCPNTPSELIGEFLRQGEILRKRVFSVGSDPEMHHRIARMCDAFAIVALMAELEQVAPDRAAKVAEQVADCWEDGGSVGEFLYDWNEAHAAGRPVGFNPPPVLPLDITRTTP